MQDLKARFACKHLHLVVKTEEEEQEATAQDLKLILAKKLFHLRSADVQGDIEKKQRLIKDEVLVLIKEYYDMAGFYTKVLSTNLDWSSTRILRIPCSTKMRKRIWESEVREALLENAMFFIRLEQLNVTEEEKTSVALGQKKDLVFHRKYFAAWLPLLPGL